MKKQGKSLRRIGAWALAAAMILGVAVPASPVTVQAEEPVNLALNAIATANDTETDDYQASNAVDGVVNREAPKPQSRWATNTSADQAPKILTVNLGAKKTFQSFVIAWERLNITAYKIEIADSNDEQTEWTPVYTKEGTDPISDLNENIHLPEPVEAQYVRLYVDGYNRNPGDWQSVSVYEFQVYENEIPDDLLTEENYNLEGTAVANDYEETEGDTQAPSMAIDGNKETRWATNVSQGIVERTLTVTLPASQRVQFFRIIWERLNIDGYKIEVAESDNAEFREVYSTSTAITTTNEVISLASPVWAKKIRLTVNDYNGGDKNWPNVSVAEFEAYAVEPGSIKDDSTAQEIADVLTAPVVNEEEGKLEITETVPKGVTVEFLADYEQVVGKDGTIYQPLTDKEIKLIYKVTRDGESAEGTVEHTVTIPGQYETAGTNAKPTVIPELAEWYGGNQKGSFSIGGNAAIYADPAFAAAAQALADDYNAEMGTNLTVVDNEGSANILFKTDSSSGLGEEGYIMEIGDNTLTVKAQENTGAYWATRSIIQIGELNTGSIPKGITKDYPKYEVRSFSLDVARKPASMDMLEDVVKAMSYYKMNDFQVHLNDNLIFYENAFFDGAEDARERAYTGFRLESDIVEDEPKGQMQDLTNEDLYYTKEEFRQFIETADSMGINIVPEIDAPGHSGAFTKVRPDLMLPESKVVSGRPARAGEQFDLSGDVTSPDSQYSKSLAFVQSVWNEYLTDNMFDSGMTVHIGTDEYYGQENAFRHFSDDMIEFIQDTGRTVRMWGSLTQIAGDGTVDVRSENVQLNVWNTGYSNPKQMYNDGFDLINTLDGTLYMVPNGGGGRGGYGDYLNITSLYNNWEPNNFGGTVIPAGSEQMLGSTFAIWNDNIDTSAQGISEVDNFERFEDALPIVASKDWGEGSDLTFDEVVETSDQLGDAPQSNPYSKAEADDNNEYMSYEFTEGAETADSSEMNRELSDPAGSAEFADGKLVLNGGESYVTTKIDKLATGSTLSFDIKLNAPAQAGQILFEADHAGANDDYVHDIRIMDDGRLGFRRELYDYYFDYKLPVGQEVHIEITTDTLETTLTVDGQEYKAVGLYRNRQTDNTVRKENISNATLLLPLQRIGSKTNAIAAEIDNVNVTVAQESGAEYNKAGWTGTASSEYTGNPSSTEGEIEKAFDNNSGTIWHSKYTGDNSMKLVCAEGGTLETVSAEIDLGKAYTINQFSFTPRTGADSGQVTKADLYVKAEGGDWVQVAENQVFANDASQKTFYFKEQEVRYIKFVAKESDDGWVAVSEFDIANVPEQTYTVYVDAQEGGSVSGGDTGLAANTEVTVTARADKGYTFAGWYDAVTEKNVSDKAEYTFPVTENTALRAYFTKNNDPEETHTVTLIVGDNETTKTVKDGETAKKPEDPTKAGHQFLGWYEAGSDTAFNFGDPITANVTLTAMFKPYSVTVAEGVEGVTVSAMDEDGYVTVTAQEKEGYKFIGWKINEEMVYEGLSYQFIPTEDTVAEPVYEEVIPGTTYYTVTINGVTSVTKEVAEGTILVRPADPVKVGYKFIGWYVDDKEYDFSAPVMSDLVIEARFEKLDTPVDPEKPGTDTPDSTNGKTDKEDGKAVQTGDQSSPVVWVVVLVAACAAAGAVVVIRKKNKKK